MQCIIVTGGSGLIGAALVNHFAGPFRVFSLDVNEPRVDLPSNASYIKIDLTSDSDVPRVLDQIAAEVRDPIASVIHLAAYYDFSGKPSDLYEKVTVRGTERLLRSLQHAKVEQFVFSSTMLVHKPTEPGKPLDEDWPLEGKWDYPQSKIDSERIIHEIHDGIPAVILRVAGVYTDTCDSLPIAQQIKRIHQRGITSHVFPGDVDTGQAFVHLDDLVDAFARTVDRRDRLPDEVAFLIGEPETFSYDQIQQELARLIHGESDWTTKEIPKALAKAGAAAQDKMPGVDDPFIKPWMIDLADDHFELDITRANKLLGWAPRHRLFDTLKNMVEALKADPGAWYERHHLEPPD